MAETTKNILSTYLRRLTNLSGNNRSLVLLRLQADQLIDVHELSFLAGDRSFEIINALIAGRNKKLCQVLDSRMEANNNASRKLKRLQRVDRFFFEERGTNDLHVGWPFVHGKFSDGSLVRCPLLYFPVTIVQEGQHWVLQPRNDAGITFNKSFLLAYAFYNQLQLDDELLETNFEEFDTDSTVFRTQLYQTLRDKIEVNFNPENFHDELIPFQEFKKPQFYETHYNGELKLFPEAVLGIFPQAGSQLVPDYLRLIEQQDIHTLEDFFLEKNEMNEATDGTGRASNNTISEEKLYTPFVLDAFQENAIKTIKQGKSIVIQGPPGTGKSQLICNLLADAIASGKKALLVCQKRAALDVVYDRLKGIELGDFLGLVHDFRNDRKEIFSKVASQVERIEEFKAHNRGIDVIQTERRFFQICRRIDQILEELEEFKFALFDDKECGISVKELYLTSDLHAPSINCKQEYQYFSFVNLSEFARRLKAYANYALVIEDDAYLWRDRKSFSSYNGSDERLIDLTLEDIPRYQEAKSMEVEKLIGARINLEDCDLLYKKEEEILGMISVLKDEDTFRFFQAMINEPDEETSLLWLSNVERVSLNCFNGPHPENTLPGDQLGKFQEVLQHCMDSRRNIFRWIKWELMSKDKFFVKRVLVANGLAVGKAGLNTLEQRIDSRLNLEHHLTGLKQRSWLIDIPAGYNKDELKNWFVKQKLATRAKLVFNTLREIKDAINVQKYDHTGFISLMRELLQTIQDIPEKKKEWLQHLSTYQLNQLIHDPSLEPEFQKILRRDFDSICEYDRLREDLKFFEKDILGKLFDHLNEWKAEPLEILFQNSIRLAWIDHIETKYPILRSVSSMKMETLQEELQQLVEEKQKLSRQILLVRARERVYESLEYNRLNNMVTYRDLQHQVTKKKKIWPIRKLLANFHYELFQLIPCWMTSPESVSAIFPMTELFDVVIFDEASQCFAERGIPAMFRGKQVVVAGDDKQLRPSELYQIRWDDSGESPDLEVESLLELSARYLSTVHLQGHYRSKSLELIDFSNRHFYEGRLQLLPDREIINRREPAIEYQVVPGVWENQTNQIEADAVVARVMEILREHPEKEIGVVTFNAPQQMLVLDLLEAASLRSGWVIPVSLFVKNIENVQGDEKDYIIFSTGYAPDQNGKMYMQFGSLNTAGGENRLNVAVTRAREKIILISSISPEQLKVEDIKNEGPRLLRKYLEFARDVYNGKFRPETTHRLKLTPKWYLSSRLQQWSRERMGAYTFNTDSLPYADINVVQSDEHLGIILTDDVRYFSSLSAKDVHAYTPALLTKKNWKYHMVFSRNFWKDREKVENDLMVFVGSRDQQKS